VGYRGRRCGDNCCYTSPILGAIADVARSKKLFLGIFTAISIAFTAALFCGPGDVVMAMVFFILAEIGYRARRSFMTTVGRCLNPRTVGNISGKGWAIGMLGGILALVLVLVPMQFAGEVFKPNHAFLITAVVFLVSSYSNLFVCQRKHEVVEQLPLGKLIKDSFPEAGKHL